jgi:hypothetical protein
MKTSLFTILVLFLFFLNAGEVAGQIQAHHCTGLDVDGTDDDWLSCSSPENTFTLRQVGIPGSLAINNGLKVRIAHDDVNFYVLARVKGDYYFNLTNGNTFSHSSSVMWRVGSRAIMNNMGGCPLPSAAAIGASSSYDCTAYKAFCQHNASLCNCADYMVDVWHMETASPGALPGVLYPLRVPNFSGGSSSSVNYDPSTNPYQTVVERLISGNDHTSNSDDEYSVHPCLRADDGSSSAHLRSYKLNNTIYQNQLKYAWSHTALNSYMYPFASQGSPGWYTYEFSRPKRSLENTDANFSTSAIQYFAFAYWTPVSTSEGWGDANHYVAPDNFNFATVTLAEQTIAGSGATGHFTKVHVIISVIICVSAILNW